MHFHVVRSNIYKFLLNNAIIFLKKEKFAFKNVLILIMFISKIFFNIL